MRASSCAARPGSTRASTTSGRSGRRACRCSSSCITNRSGSTASSRPRVHELLELGVPAPHLCDGVLVLPPAPHALVMAAHTWGHYPLTPLRDLLDIALVARMADPAELERLAEAWGLARVWRTTWRATDSLFGDGAATRLHADLGPPSRGGPRAHGSGVAPPALAGRLLGAPTPRRSQQPPSRRGPRPEARGRGALERQARPDAQSAPGRVRSQIAPRPRAHSAIRERAMTSYDSRAAASTGARWKAS